MPSLFKQFDTFVDIRYYVGVGYINSNSKTALEALATGMDVYSWERKIIHGLPKQHLPLNAVKDLLKVYGV
jgi:hypothetical protein